MVNFYTAILADGEQILQGVLKARDGGHARDRAFTQAKELVDFERFPKIRWDIVASERPFPKGLKIVQCEHGREFLFVPKEWMNASLFVSDSED